MTNIAKTRVFESYPRITANTLQRLKNDIKILNMFELIQTTVILLTLITGFLILLYSLLNRRRTTVWSLWCALLCGFIQVCYTAVAVFSSKHASLQPELVSVQCSDTYTIPMFCDILTMTIFVTSAIGVHFKGSKASILKHIFFVYILVCSVFIIAVHSLRDYCTSNGFTLTSNLHIQPLSCRSDPRNDILLIAGEYVLIYFPMAAALLIVYSRSSKTQENPKQIQFLIPCCSNDVCGSCQHQNMVCNTVLMAYCLCMYIVRPLIVLLCSVKDILSEDITPSLVSTSVYIYLCFEYCRILQEYCKISQETQTYKDNTRDKTISNPLDLSTEVTC